MKKSRLGERKEMDECHFWKSTFCHLSRKEGLRGGVSDQHRNLVNVRGHRDHLMENLLSTYSIKKRGP